MGKNNDSAYGGLFVISLIVVVLLVVCGGGAAFMIFGFRMNSTTAVSVTNVGPTAVTQTKGLLLDAEGPIQLPEDNSLSEEFLKSSSLTTWQHEYFKTVITKYRSEVEEIASPKIAYSLTDKNLLKIEISPFESDGAEIEKDLRENLLQELNEDQLTQIQNQINLFTPFYGFGQYILSIEFGPREGSPDLFDYKRTQTKDNISEDVNVFMKLKDNPAWQSYENKRQELLKKYKLKE